MMVASRFTIYISPYNMANGIARRILTTGIFDEMMRTISAKISSPTIRKMNPPRDE